MAPQIAIIGSFKQYFEEILKIVDLFNKNNIIVTTPLGTRIIKPEVDFVRFQEDLTEESDEMVQTITLKRIFNAGVVYAVLPNGYVGRTTCYEIGRALQRKMPIYFSAHPKDLPIKIPNSHVLNPAQLVEIILSNKATWPFSKLECSYSRLENEILEIP